MLKALYTTGLHVQDLRDAELHGRADVVLAPAVNNTGRVVLDDNRLVSESRPKNVQP